MTGYLVPRNFEDIERQLAQSIGFDTFFNRLLNNDYSAVNGGGYPPYNIRKVDDYKYVIELALAGFDKDDLDIELAEGTLTVKSVPKDKDNDTDYIHHGIAKRVFTRKFHLANDIVVKGADLFNGLLTIELERVIPEEKRPRKIVIDDGVKKVEHKVV
jgi:molecular chaperone IbpA